MCSGNPLIRRAKLKLSNFPFFFNNGYCAEQLINIYSIDFLFLWHVDSSFFHGVEISPMNKEFCVFSLSFFNA